MADLVLGVSAGLTGWLLTYLLHSTVVLAAAATLMRALSLRPAARDVLLRVGLLGGVITATLAVVLGGDSADSRHLVIAARTSAGSSAAWPSTDGRSMGRHAVERGTLTGAPVDADATIEIRARLVDPSPECMASLRSAGQLRGDGVERVERVCVSSGEALFPTTWFLGVVGLWLLGALFGLACTARRLPALRDVQGSLTDPSPRSRRLFAALLGSAVTTPRRVRPPRLARSDAVETPCVLPGSTIVLPARCEAELSDEELRAVLAHELAHVERRDVLWCGALRALTTLLWVQPLNRIAMARLVDTVEHRCDDRALERTGERLGLARSIFRVAHMSLEGRRPAPGVSMTGGPRGGLGERVRRILHDDPPRPEPAWVRAGLAVSLVLPLLWLPAVPAPAALEPAMFVREREALLVEEGVLVAMDPAVRPVDPGVPDTAAQPVRLFVTRIQTRSP